eukprot:3419550-Prymnesium_polylepis.1
MEGKPVGGWASGRMVRPVWFGRMQSSVYTLSVALASCLLASQPQLSIVKGWYGATQSTFLLPPKVKVAVRWAPRPHTTRPEKPPDVVQP